MPLAHQPGHAQADFGEAIGIIGGVEDPLLGIRPAALGRLFCSAYPAEPTSQTGNSPPSGHFLGRIPRVFPQRISKKMGGLGSGEDRISPIPCGSGWRMGRHGRDHPIVFVGGGE